MSFDVHQWVKDAPLGTVRIDMSDPRMWRTINGVEQPFRAFHVPAMVRGRIVELRQRLWSKWMAIDHWPDRPTPPIRLQVTFAPGRLPL